MKNFSQPYDEKIMYEYMEEPLSINREYAKNCWIIPLARSNAVCTNIC
ncbi:MAG: hypothetical protein NC132_06670 [Corallococcus sp.]|nr:hypothetical protein [Corallococcus sp.]MCM1360169.1 hypothetical protein [Corallococcus sp.]MCM1395766.1 hypothetical protein [Corallococcus sp.]